MCCSSAKLELYQVVRWSLYAPEDLENTHLILNALERVDALLNNKLQEHNFKSSQHIGHVIDTTFYKH